MNRTNNILVIGGADIVNNPIYKDKHFYMIGNHEGAYYGQELDWNLVEFWTDLCKKIMQDNLIFDCVIIDEGSGSWLLVNESIYVSFIRKLQRNTTVSKDKLMNYLRMKRKELVYELKSEICISIYDIIDKSLSPNGVIILNVINNIRYFNNLTVNKYEHINKNTNITPMKNIDTNKIEFYKLKLLLFQRFEKLKSFIMNDKQNRCVYCILSKQNDINNTVLSNIQEGLYDFSDIRKLKEPILSKSNGKNTNYNTYLVDPVEEKNQIDFCIRRIINNHNNH